MIELRPKQLKAKADIRAAFVAGHKTVLHVSPTGSGKTVIFSSLAHGSQAKGKFIAILTHREELIDQISRTLREFHVPHGLIQAGAKYDPTFLTQIASVPTLVHRLRRVRVPDFVIVDEAHHCIPDSQFGQVVNTWRRMNPALRVLGVTASPIRLSGEGLGDMFETLVMGPTVGELIDDGHLSKFRMFAPVALDLSGVHSRGGDYVRAEIEELMNKPQVVGDMVGHYRKYLNGAPTAAFCVTRKHAHMVAERFRQAGFNATCIDGTMDKQYRRTIVNEIRSEKLSVVTSCEILNEGFDCPGLVGGLFLRPTQSLGLCLQQWGRILRKHPGKDSAILLDHVSNSLRHGLPDDEREWSLQGREKRAKGQAEESVERSKSCQKCYAANSLTAQVCRECGEAFKVQSRVIEEVAGELSEIDVARARRQRGFEEHQCTTLEQLRKLGESRGYGSGWAFARWKARQAKHAKAGT